VARRWRIRHKLMLGLATAIAILAMLLAGTLNGLWSYYVTMKSIKSKLAEFEAAEDLKRAVGNLALSDKSDNLLAELAKYETRIQTAGDGITAFEEAVQSTHDRNLPHDNGEQLFGTIQALRRQLSGLREEIAQSTDMVGIGSQGTQELFDLVRNRIEKKVKALERTSDDARSIVHDDLNRRIDHSRRHYQIPVLILATVSVLGLVLMLSALRFFYGWIFNPVRDLQMGVNRVAEGDFDYRIDVKSGDEMEELAAAFNDMTCRLRDLYRDMAHQINERSRQLVRSERLASVGFLAAGVAHEINNPLASIAFCSEALEGRLVEMQDQLRLSAKGKNDLEVFAKYLKMIQEEAFRCKNITERLLEFSRGGERKRERIDLAQLIQSVLDVTHHLPNSRGKDIVFKNPTPVFAWVSVEEIKSVVLNLVVNALDSMDEGGRVTIDLKSRDGLAELVLTDTGCGMTAEVLENIFEPFFTRNRSGKGTGLGLTITHRIVSQHGGEIEASSPGAGQGSTFRVRLPLQPAGEGNGTGKEESLGNAA
jgi:signal transduction histidine kinase